MTFSAHLKYIRLWGRAQLWHLANISKLKFGRIGNEKRLPLKLNLNCIVLPRKGYILPQDQVAKANLKTGNSPDEIWLIIPDYGQKNECKKNWRQPWKISQLNRHPLVASSVIRESMRRRKPTSKMHWEWDGAGEVNVMCVPRVISDFPDILLSWLRLLELLRCFVYLCWYKRILT